VTNSGAIYTDGVGWSAGIETRSDASNYVGNSGLVYASAYGDGSHAYAIYASGGDVTVVNDGGAIALGYYATGIEAQGTGNVSVVNGVYAGAIAANSALATAIDASSSGEGAAVSVSNDGVVYASGDFGATGIAATATGEGGTASITNTGDVYAEQGNKYGYGAYGAIASADGDATGDNSGLIEVSSAGGATGAAALSFAGNASVPNSGDIPVGRPPALS